MEPTCEVKSKTEHSNTEDAKTERARYREIEESQNKTENSSCTTDVVHNATVLDTFVHLDLLKQDLRHFTDTDFVDVNAHPLIADERASVSSCESGLSWMEMRFQLHADAVRFSQFVQLSVIFASMYSMTASIAFFSSLYPVDKSQLQRHSTVDAFLLTSAIIAIDISSAFFVVTGFFCAYTLTNVNSSDITMLFRIVVLHTVIDIWLATLLSVIFGSIFHILRGTFSPHDITLTMIEGITCLRTFELSQSPDAMHSLNPTSWPVLCLLYCFVLTPWTMSSNHRLHSCYPRAGLLLLLVNAIVPIVTISLFALLHEDTNIFFINSTHFGYRLLEFNMGVCFFACIQSYPVASTKFTHAVQYLHPIVSVTFLLVWWAQLGTSVQANYGTCIRMYFFSPCIQMHHGFLMRGCFLGITLLSKIMLSSKEISMFDVISHGNIINSQGAWLASGVTSVVLIWPACYIVHIVLELNFNVSLVHENASLLVIIVPVITWAVASLWNNTWKLSVVNSMDKTIDRLVACCIRKQVQLQEEQCA
jgi:hypothetical protein